MISESMLQPSASNQTGRNEARRVWSVPVAYFQVIRTFTVLVVVSQFIRSTTMFQVSLLLTL